MVRHADIGAEHPRDDPQAEVEGPDSRRLPPDLVTALNGQLVRAIADYLAWRLGIDSGNQRLEFSFRDGSCRQSRWDHGPVQMPELEAHGLRRLPP